MTMDIVAQKVFEARYGRTLEDGSQESWTTAAVRIADGNLALVDSSYHTESGEREAIVDFISEMKIMPSGRMISWGGVDDSRLASCRVLNFEGSWEDFEAAMTQNILDECGVGTNYSTFTEFGLNPIEVMFRVQALVASFDGQTKRPMALMSILNWMDPHIFEFINAKETNGTLCRTNISVEVDDEFIAAFNAGDEHAVAVAEAVVDGMLRNGEPGFFNGSLSSVGEPSPVRATAPCGELALGNNEPCVMLHFNPAFCSNDEIHEVIRLTTRMAVRMAKVSGTMRIGVGFIGLQEWMAKNGMSFTDKDHTVLGQHLSDWYNTVRNTADEYTNEMGMLPLIKVTTVAPVGKIAKLAGTTEGIHPVFAPYHIERIAGEEIVRMDPVVERLGHEVPGIFDLTFNDMCRLVACVQANYADNGIAFTFNFDQGTLNAKSLLDEVMEFLPFLKGVTLMPNGAWENAPKERISKEQFEQYEQTATGTMSDHCQGKCTLG